MKEAIYRHNWKQTDIVGLMYAYVIWSVCPPDDWAEDN